MPTTTWSPVLQIAQAAAGGAAAGDHDHRVHALVLHFHPLAVDGAPASVIGGGIEILRRAAVALDRAELGVAGIDRRAAQAEQLAEQLLHVGRVRRFDPQAQVGRVAIGAADAELFDFEAAVVFDHLVEDLLHEVGIDQVAFGLDDFLLHG